MVLKISDIENMLYLRGTYFWMQYCCILTYNSVVLNISQKQENTWMQYCCILTYNSVALNISLK